MNELERKRLIRPETLDPRSWFPSLCEQAAAAGLLAGDDIRRLQGELYALLAEASALWSNGRSSSIPAAEAQELLASIVYTIGIRLKACAVPDEAVCLLQTPLKPLYEKGLAMIHRKVTAAGMLHKRLKAGLFQSPNVFWRETAVNGIDGFFRLYRPAVAAHETHITADYPTLAPRPMLDGIEFIERYLWAIDAENTFLCCFQPERVHILLCSGLPDYENTPVNLAEPVLAAFFGLACLGKPPEQLNLTAEDCRKLTEWFAGVRPAAIECECRRILDEWNGPAKALRYVNGALEVLSERISRAPSAVFHMA